MTVPDGAEAGAIAEMGDERRWRKRAAGLRRQGLDDMFIVEAVEAIAPVAALEIVGGQGEAQGDLGLGRVEGRVETGHLRDLRGRLAHAAQASRPWG